MTLDQLTLACPPLASALARDPALRPVAERLLDAGLDGALRSYLADADPATVETFLLEATRLDLDQIERHRRALAAPAETALLPEDVEPARLFTLDEQKARQTRDEQAGLESLRAGRWASVAFAGGSGTRFFSRIDELDRALRVPNEALRNRRFDPTAPKGVFPISPVFGLCFFDLILAEALATGIRVGRLPWILLLTSSQTHAATVDALVRSDLWGLPRVSWLAFVQRDEPRLDARGDLVVADDSGRLAWTGDGHGGVYRALLSPTGDGPSPLERIRSTGVDQLVMHNVDNAAARPFWPARLGFHLLERSWFTLSATRKTDPQEQVGVLMRLRATGKLEVVEYNVISEAIASLASPDGRLTHESGNINTNLAAVEALRPDIDPTLYTGKWINSRTGPVETSSLEMLNQHLTRTIDPDRVRAYEVQREAFFMPTKNVTGVDSVESTVRMMSNRYAELLSAAGARIASDAICDLHPVCGLEPPDLARQGLGPGWEIEPGARLYLCAAAGPTDQEPIGAAGLQLESGAQLLLDCQRPYGDLSLAADRQLRADPASASRVSLGAGLVVRKGVRVTLRVGRGARLRVRPGRVFAEDLTVKLGPGDELDL